MPAVLTDADVGLAPGAGGRVLSDADVGLTPPSLLSDSDVGLAPPKPLTAPGIAHQTFISAPKAALGAWERFAGGVAKGLGSMQEIQAAGDVRRLAAQTAMEQPPEKEIAPADIPPVPAAAIQAGIARNPIYQAGVTTEEAAPALTPSEQAGNITKLGSLVGGGAGMALGPFAIPSFALDAIGRHAHDDYAQLKARNPDMTDEQAAEKALDNGILAGTVNAAVFTLLPKAARPVLEKYIVDKYGTAVLNRFLLGRVAAAGETSAVLGGSTAAENAATGQPVGQGVGSSTLTGLVTGLLLPWLRDKGDSPSPMADSRAATPDAITQATAQHNASVSAEPAAAGATPTVDINELLTEMQRRQISKGQNETSPIRTEPETPAAGKNAEPGDAAVPAAAGIEQGAAAQPGAAPGAARSNGEDVSQAELRSVLHAEAALPTELAMRQWLEDELAARGRSSKSLLGQVDVDQMPELANDPYARAIEATHPELAAKIRNGSATPDEMRLAVRLASAENSAETPPPSIQPEVVPTHPGATGSEVLAAGAAKSADRPKRLALAEVLDELAQTNNEHGSVERLIYDQLEKGIWTQEEADHLATMVATERLSASAIARDPMFAVDWNQPGEKNAGAATEATSTGKNPLPTDAGNISGAAVGVKNELTNGAPGGTRELAAPETITGGTGTPETSETPASTIQARTGAPSATESGTIPAEPANAGRSAAASRTRGSITGQRGWDLVDEAQNVAGRAGIDPTLITEANPDWKPIGAARKLFRKGGMAADEAAQALSDAGIYRGDPGQVDQLGEALNAAARGRTADRRTNAEETRLASEEGAFERDKGRPGPNQRVMVADDLQVGDQLRIRGTRLKVKSLEYDDDGRVIAVTLEDGAKYGTQQIAGGTELMIDKRTVRHGDPDLVTSRTIRGTNFTQEARPGEAGVKHTDQLEAWANEILKGGAAHAGPEVIAAYAVKGAYVIARVARQVALSFEHWSNQMLEEFGAKIGPHLREIWPQALRLREEQLGESAKQALDETTQKEIARELAEVQAERAKAPVQVKRLENELPADAGVPVSPETAKRQGEIADRLGQLSEIERRGQLTAELRSERAALGRESRELARGQSRDPAYVADLLRRLEKAGNDLVNARKAGNGAHASELALEMESLMGSLEEVPQKLRNRVYRELIDKGEVMGPGAKVRPQAFDEMDQESDRSRKPDESGAPGLTPAQSRAAALAEKLPGPLGDLVRWANDAHRKLVAMYQRSPNRAELSLTKDAADNTATIFSKRGSNVILHALNRAFGKDFGERSELREGALSMLLEAGAGTKNGGDVGENLQAMRDALKASKFANGRWARKALAMIDFAEREQEKLEPVAQAYAQLTDAERASEQAAGYNTLYRNGGYVFHLQDMAAGFDAPDVAGSRESGGMAPAPFKHVRDYATYADSIAAGVTPKSLSAVDLLQRRLALGRRMVNYGAWVDSMRSLVDPHTQLPLVTDSDVRIRGDGSEDVRAPSGYFLTNFGGRQVAVLSGYSGIFHALTEGSAMRQNALSVGLMRAMAMGKQFTLLGDTFHAGRLAFWNGITRLGAPTYSRGQTLLDNTVAEIRRMGANREIPAEWAQTLDQDRTRLDAMLKRGLNLGNVSDNLFQDVIHSVPGLGQFNRWLFERYQRGAMTEVSLIEFERVSRMFPEMTDDQVASKVAQAVNTRFGNLQSQGLFKSKTFQDLARTLFLAPQWNESLIRAELGALREAGGAPGQSIRAGRPVMGMLARGVATAAVGTFFANQLINYFTRGKPTWENEEGADSGVYGWAGAKISAHIPDAAGGPGFFLNPMGIPLEITHLLLKTTERSGGNFAEALREFVAGRLNNASRPVWTMISREDMLGRKQRTGADLAATMAKEAVPLPISSTALYRMGKQALTGQHEEAFPGQFQKQLMQSAGVRTESAPGPESRMFGLARRFNSDRGIQPSAEFYAGDFQALSNALRLGNERDAEAALDDLLAKKTPSQIVSHFQTWERGPFTGQRGRETQFYQSLNPEQQQTYQKAREQRQALATKAIELLRSRAMARQGVGP